jgi:hypothetical protein
MESIKIKDFLDRLHKRLEKEGDHEALLFYEVFLEKSVIRELSDTGRMVSNWQELDLIAGDYDLIYPFSANMLHRAASAGFSEHSNTYAIAHKVSIAFCHELNEVFGFTGDNKYDLLPIKSYVEMAAEAGAIEVVDGMVKLTPKGEEAAEIIERQINGSQN